MAFWGRQRAAAAAAEEAAREASTGDTGRALELAEIAWADSGRRIPARFGLLLDITRQHAGKPAARQRAICELERTDLGNLARGLVESRLALLCLDTSTVGEWTARALTPAEQMAMRLADAGLGHATKVPATHAPKALIHAYEGDLQEASMHADASLRGAKLVDPRWTPYVALAQVAFGMVAAGRGEPDQARAFLTLARKAEADNEWLPSLEKSLHIADQGGLTNDSRR